MEHEVTSLVSHRSWTIACMPREWQGLAVANDGSSCSPLPVPSMWGAGARAANRLAEFACRGRFKVIKCILLCMATNVPWPVKSSICVECPPLSCCKHIHYLSLEQTTYKSFSSSQNGCHCPRKHHQCFGVSYLSYRVYLAGVNCRARSSDLIFTSGK